MAKIAITEDDPPTMHEEDGTVSTLVTDGTLELESSLGSTVSFLSAIHPQPGVETNAAPLLPRKALSTGCLIHTTQKASLGAPPFRSASDKRVGWGSLEIHSHIMTLGDNPAVCGGGVPVCLCWEAEHHDFVSSVEEYEDNRTGEPRTRGEMILPRMLRDDIARSAGFARSEMKEAKESVKLIQENRKKSAKDGALLEKLQRFLSRKPRSQALAFANDD